MELNCIVIDDEPHAIAEFKELIALTPGISLRESFNSVEDAITHLQDYGTVDVVFSDIGMPMTDGIEGAKMLTIYCGALVYTTAHRHFGEQAFREGASGYLVKPLKHERFVDQVKQLQALKEKKKRLEYEGEKFAFIKGSTKGSFITVFYHDIMYIEAALNYIKIFTPKQTEITYLGLKELEKQLMMHPDFIRISKSYLISVNYLKKVEGNIAFMSDGQGHAIGEKYRPAFMDLLRKRMIGGG